MGTLSWVPRQACRSWLGPPILCPGSPYVMAPWPQGFQDGLGDPTAKGKGCGSFQRVLGELVPPHLIYLFPAWLLLESGSNSQVLGKGRAKASEDISMARQLSLGRMMSRFLPEWDMEQVRFDIGIGGRKFGMGGLA